LGIRVVGRALAAYPASHRHRIEHGGDFASDPDDIQRLKDYGIWLVTTPAFLYAAGAARSQRRQPHWRSLIDAGFQVIGSSDTTGSIPDGIAPMFNIGCALNYIDDPAQRITVDEALRMFTIWPAAGAFEERDKGSITPGKLGDFAVLARDPREVDPEELFDLPVDATILGGTVVYTR
jgi:predicted amidohydrolase YtcJ